MKLYQTTIGIQHTVDGYEELANAIVLQAAKDYRCALKSLKKHPCNSTALSSKLKTEQYFRSDWFATLTEINPEWLIRRLKSEVAR